MIASIQDIIDHPEAHLNAETLRELATRVQQLAYSQEGPKFVRTEATEPARKSNHYMEAMMSLTQRCAYSKSEIALLIAEQALARENAEIQLAKRNQMPRLAPFTNLSVLQEPNKLHVLVAGPTNTGKTLLLNKICEWLQSTYGVEARCNHLLQEPQQFFPADKVRHEQSLTAALHHREVILSEIHLYPPADGLSIVIPGWFETPLPTPESVLDKVEGDAAMRDFTNNWEGDAEPVLEPRDEGPKVYGQSRGVVVSDSSVNYSHTPVPGVSAEAYNKWADDHIVDKHINLT